MRQRLPAVVRAWMITTAVVLAGMTSTSQAEERPGELAFSVILVDELVLKPVPLTDFRIQSGTQFERLVRTDEQGLVTVRLPVGKYTIENLRPVTFKGRSLSWRATFVIEADELCRIRLTDADATQTSAPAARQVSDEARIYRELKDGVVTVECDFGRGTGFVVDPRGLILTNQHVVNNTRWAAVRFDRGVRIPATVVHEDRDADVAVVCFNPEAFREFRVVPLASTTDGPVAVEGEKVLTIGSPLNQEKILTTGIVSKVERDVLISDVNVNHGNSGGPLLNLAGEAIGITTFGDFSRQGGPGISGIVAIHRVMPVLEAARKKIATIMPPSKERLPDISPTPIPGPALAEAALKEKKPFRFKEPKNFLTVVVTPFTMASIESAYEREIAKGKNRRARKRSNQGVKEGYNFQPRWFWEAHAISSRQAVVAILVQPVLKETSGSKWRGALGAAFGVNTRKEYAYRDDFYQMELYRGDRLVLPVRQGREQVDISVDGWFVGANDAAYAGLYYYDPSIFEPSEPLTLKVLRESNLEKWTSVQISPKVQKQIWEEFASYRQVAEAADASSR